jgi:hypothetical protein
MDIAELKNELLNWRLTRYKAVNLAIGFVSLLLLEFVARAYYRPYIYSNNIFDYHIADTLGNSLGTIAGVFIFVGILTSNKRQGLVMVTIVTIAFVVYEIGHPLLGKTIDVWDVLATVITGGVCYFIVGRFRES